MINEELLQTLIDSLPALVASAVAAITGLIAKKWIKSISSEDLKETRALKKSMKNTNEAVSELSKENANIKTSLLDMIGNTKDEIKCLKETIKCQNEEIKELKEQLQHQVDIQDQLETIKAQNQALLNK